MIGEEMQRSISKDYLSVVENFVFDNLQYDPDNEEYKFACGNNFYRYISESGMANREDVQLVREAGVEGILVGETLMKANNIVKTMLELSLKEVSS